MIKSRELTEPNSCMNKAEDDEIVFVLLARDAAAAYAVRDWAHMRITMGLNTMEDPQIIEAFKCAEKMDAQRPIIKQRIRLKKSTPILPCPTCTDNPEYVQPGRTCVVCYGTRYV